MSQHLCISAEVNFWLLWETIAKAKKHISADLSTLGRLGGCSKMPLPYLGLYSAQSFNFLQMSRTVCTSTAEINLGRLMTILSFIIQTTRGQPGAMDFI